MRRFAVLIFGLWLSMPGWAQSPLPQVQDLVGSWSGWMTHAGERSPMALEIQANPDGKVALRLTLPAIHVRSLPLGSPAWKLDGDTVVLGPFRLKLDRAQGALLGEMPEALVPVYRVPFSLTRVDRLESTPRPALEAPEAQPIWERRLGSAQWAGPTHAGKFILTGGEDGVLHALDARSGQPQWRFKAAGPIRCRATVEGNRVYFQSDDGMLHALTLESGQPLWQQRVAKSPAKRLASEEKGSRYDRFAAEVAVQGDRLYVGTHEGLVRALQASDGREIWHFDTGDAVLAAPALDAKRVYVGSFEGSVWALERDTGSLFWRHATGKPVVSTPAVAGDRLVVGSRSYDLLGLDAATGHPAWTYYVWMSWIESSATVREGMAYVGSSDAAAIYALDTATGRLTWKSDVRGWSWGQPAVTADRVYAGTASTVGYGAGHEGGLVALDRKTGKPRWRFRIPSPTQGTFGIPGSPACGQGLVFVTDLEGRVLAFKA